MTLDANPDLWVQGPYDKDFQVNQQQRGALHLGEQPLVEKAAPFFKYRSASCSLYASIMRVI